MLAWNYSPDSQTGKVNQNESPNAGVQSSSSELIVSFFSISIFVSFCPSASGSRVDTKTAGLPSCWVCDGWGLWVITPRWHTQLILSSLVFSLTHSPVFPSAPQFLSLFFSFSIPLSKPVFNPLLFDPLLPFPFSSVSLSFPVLAFSSHFFSFLHLFPPFLLYTSPCLHPLPSSCPLLCCPVEWQRVSLGVNAVCSVVSALQPWQILTTVFMGKAVCLC